jgi:heme-degrading monooxygenase HmoA
MVTEIAVITINPERDAEFERAVASAASLFQGASGCRGMRLEREIEDPGRYRLFVEWDTVEDHTEGFRNSEAFKQWRALVGPYFLAPPQVVHTTLVARHV